MKMPAELIPFVNKRVNVRLEDGYADYGVLRIWEMQGPRERPFVLEPSDTPEIHWTKRRRFYAREIADIQLVAEVESGSATSR
jgi:hypothetical protein